MERNEQRRESARRRVPAEGPRQRQIVVRFSDAELVVVRERAGLAGLAVGAWVGQTVLGVAKRGSDIVVGLPDLLRLHADVVSVERAARAVGAEQVNVAQMLVRLDAAVDAVVADLDRPRQ
ncbi:MAG: hypothetical protein L0H64_22890 [Pseudonocardia sp.]|nr:hypothetical protein [Pseudonocardia sp.]